MALVAILGASNNPERYANIAQRRLLASGHQVLPVTPIYAEVEGIPCVDSLAQVSAPVPVVTVYVRPTLLAESLPSLLALRPGCVIFNPGSEAPDAMRQLKQAGINVVEACTLVLLSTGQFETVCGLQPSVIPSP